jgi:hypothetical protein
MAALCEAHKDENVMTEDKQTEDESGNWSISIGGNVGPGAVIGPGSWVKADNIAGRDIDSKNELANKTREDFSGMLGELRELIVQAHDKGELDKAAADKALQSIDSATQMASEKKPLKKPLLRKLEDISDLLDGAADTIDSAGGVARVLLKAIPVAALLLKLASYLF